MQLYEIWNQIQCIDFFFVLFLNVNEKRTLIQIEKCE